MNDKPFTRHWVSAIFLFIALLLDGTLMQVLSTWSSRISGPGAPQILLMVLVLIAIFVPDESWVVPMALVFGLLMDMFYTGVIGVSALVLPLITYCVRQLRPYVAHTGIVTWAIFIIAMSSRLFGEYALMSVMSLTNLSFVDMVTQAWAPGLTVNVILFIIIYYPCTRLLVKLTQK